MCEKLQDNCKINLNTIQTDVQTIRTLKSILGDDAIDTQHIGSTEVHAIKAKTIIDISIGSIILIEQCHKMSNYRKKESFIVVRM